MTAFDNQEIDALTLQMRDLERLHRQADDAGNVDLTFALGEHMNATVRALAVAMLRRCGNEVVEYYGLDRGTSTMCAAIAAA